MASSSSKCESTARRSEIANRKSDIANRKSEIANRGKKSQRTLRSHLAVLSNIFTYVFQIHTGTHCYTRQPHTINKFETVCIKPVYAGVDIDRRNQKKEFLGIVTCPSRIVDKYMLRIIDNSLDLRKRMYAKSMK